MTLQQPFKKCFPFPIQWIFVGFLMTVQVHVLFGQINWQFTNGPEGGGTIYIRENDNYAFYPDQHHLYRSADGQHWEKLPYGKLWEIGASNGTIAALQGNRLARPLSDIHFLVSHDNGSTWIEGSLPPTKYGTFSSIAVDTNGIFVTDGIKGFIFRTQDDGLTWDTITPPGTYCYHIWSFENRLYTEGYGKFWRLTADNTSWEVVSPNFDAQDYPYSMFIAGPIRLFSCEKSLWGSNDGGLTWKKTPIPYHNSYDRFMQVGNRIYKRGGSTDLMYTEDGGQSWTSVLLTPDFNMFDLSTVNGELICTAGNKGVLRLDVNTNKLVQSNYGLTSAAVYKLQADSTHLWAICGNGIFAYQLADQLWKQMPLPMLDRIDYPTVISNGSGKIFTHVQSGTEITISHDNGLSWSSVDPYATAGFWPENINRLQLLGNNLFVLLDSEEKLVSKDWGQTWTAAEEITRDPVEFKGKYYGISYWAKLSSSADTGLTWQDIPAPWQYVSRLYATDDRLFLAGQKSGSRLALYTSTDGVNWTYANDGLPTFEDISVGSKVLSGKIWRKNNKYFLGENGIGLFVSLDTCKTWLPVERTTVLELVDTTFYKGSTSGGVWQTGLPQNYGLRVSGIVYKDDNNNGVQDAGEVNLPHVQVNVFERNPWCPYWFTTTREDGHFAIGVTPGRVDSIGLNLHTGYVQQINPPAYLIDTMSSGYHFGVHFSEDITDAAALGFLNGRPRPGFDVNTLVRIANKGTLPVSGVFSLKLDPNMQLVSAEPAPSAIIGSDSLIWDISQLSLFDDREIWINSMVPVTAPMGSAVKINGYMVTSVQDATPVDNHFVIVDTIVASYDPNEKRVEPAQGLTAAEIVAGKDLLYTVLFQNTGTYEASRVRITDHLDTALNLKTLQLVGASHPVTRFELLPGGLLEVVFDNIALPDSNTNEAASHGFVTFSIQRNKAYSIFRPVENTAAIYFDFNEPVITNTVVTPVYTPPVVVSAPEQPAAPGTVTTLKISPNPAGRFCTISPVHHIKGKVQLQVVNTAGKVCLRQSVEDINNGVTINTETLGEGVHTIYIIGKEGVWQGQVVVVKHQ